MDDDSIEYSKREAFNEYFGSFIRSTPKEASKVVIALDSDLRKHLEQEYGLDIMTILKLLREFIPNKPVEVIDTDAAKKYMTNIFEPVIDVSDSSTRDATVVNQYRY